MFHWLTTKPDPHSTAKGYDCGKNGWRLHAVEAPDDATIASVKHAVAVCGTRPRYGWDLDMFIVRRCSRCVQKLGVETAAETYERNAAAQWRAEKHSKKAVART